MPNDPEPPPQDTAEAAKQIAAAIDGSDLLKQLLSPQRPPLSAQNQALIRDLGRVYGDIETLTRAWRQQFLAVADPTDPALDTYARPIITLAEIIRKHKGMTSLAQSIYEWALERVNGHCAANGVVLYRGALYINLAVTLLRQGRYKSALPWLHAAAADDLAHRHDVHTIYDSYAFSGAGIFGQWLDLSVLPALPADVLAFVNAALSVAHTNDDVKRSIGSLAGRGDLHIISSVLDFAEVEGKADYHADSVRLLAIRDLATMFEVLFKQIGESHNDPTVTARFLDPPTLARLICHMHFASGLGARRANPALNANREPGVFHNPLLPNDDILDAIDAGIDFCAGNAHNVHDVWQYLQGAPFSANALADAIAKRVLLAYKLRNTTSHGFSPTDPNMQMHYNDFRLWMLQAVFILYFWARDNGYANI
jgi:hypothetical protein